MKTQNEEFSALRDSYNLYGKVLIASQQYEAELSEYIHTILFSIEEDFNSNDIEFGKKEEWTHEDNNQGERYVGTSVIIAKFKDLPVDEKTKFKLGVAYSVEIDKAIEAFPYVIMCIDHPQTAKKWQSYFKSIIDKRDKAFKLKPYIDKVYMYPVDWDSFRRQSLDQIGKDLQDMLIKFLKALQ